jgi:hypothetical protein
MGNSFRWPTSMPQNTRELVFWAFSDIYVTEDDQEYSLNCIYFFDCLDRELFNEHKEDWMLVYKQRIVKYGERKTKQQRSDLCLASFISQLTHYFVKNFLILKFPQREHSEQYFPSVPMMEENITQPFLICIISCLAFY